MKVQKTILKHLFLYFLIFTGSALKCCSTAHGVSMRYESCCTMGSGQNFDGHFPKTTDPKSKITCNLLGASQYLWEYGTGKFPKGPPFFLLVILNVDCTWPLVISMFYFNGAKDYFDALIYGAMYL